MLIATGAVRRGSVSVYYNLFPWKLGSWDKVRPVF